MMLVVITAVLLAAGASFAQAPSRETLMKVANMFPNSTLSVADRVKELEWFAKASAPYRGMKLKSVAESIATHTWESEKLTKPFQEITGIQVTHDIIGEGDVVERYYTQVASGRKLYDVYINDTDLIGMHLRHADCVNLTEYMKGEGKAVTNPTQDFNDWMNLNFGMDYDGNLLQLPDQQFPNLYLFRYDWFNDPEYKKMFKDKYGYELGVPLNWEAYEDIAIFWGEDVGEIDGVKIYGHSDYGRPSPDLGWRFSDSWFGIAGVPDKGLPFPLPVDDWGLRAENKIPVGFSVSRGGALNSPAAIYAVEKYIKWINEFAPSYARGLGVYEMGDDFGKGHIAQQIWFYTAFLGNEPYRTPGSPIVEKDGTLKYRLAPSPHGKYWQAGMKIGYQDAGAWTIPVSTKGKERAMAWLWAQFVTCKTVDVDRFIAGTTPIRKSTMNSKWCDSHLDQWGGLITFYRSPMEDKFTPTGPNVPDYQLFQEQMWHFIAPAIEGEKTAKQALDDLASTCDTILKNLFLPVFSPKLNQPKSEQEWLDAPGSPWPEITTSPAPKTMNYDDLLKKWKAGQTTF
jgi:glycerol transport system substrate-binding protein